MRRYIMKMDSMASGRRRYARDGMSVMPGGRRSFWSRDRTYSSDSVKDSPGAGARRPRLAMFTLFDGVGVCAAIMPSRLATMPSGVGSSEGSN